MSMNNCDEIVYYFDKKKCIIIDSFDYGESINFYNVYIQLSVCFLY